MLPAFDGKPISRKTPLYWQFDRAISEPKIAMRQGDWKVLADADLDRFELYNLADDPRETTDVASRHPERLKEMAALLRKMHDQIKAEGPTWPPFHRLPTSKEKD